MSAYDKQFLTADEVLARAIAKVAKSWNGIPAEATGALKKSQGQPKNLQDLHSGPLVIEKMRDPSVVAVRKALSGRKFDLSKISTPQSSNASQSGGNDDVSGYRDTPTAKPERVGPKSTASVHSGTTPTGTSDETIAAIKAIHKQKPRPAYGSQAQQRRDAKRVD